MSDLDKNDGKDRTGPRLGGSRTYDKKGKLVKETTPEPEIVPEPKPNEEAD
jgi:hypothetical protein